MDVASPLSVDREGARGVGPDHFGEVSQLQIFLKFDDKHAKMAPLDQGAYHQISGKFDDDYTRAQARPGAQIPYRQISSKFDNKASRGPSRTPF
jgi:hypothetical protein